MLTPSPFLGEFMGTLVLLLFGNGVVANVLLSKTKGNNSGLIVITTAWAMAVTFGVFVAQKFGSEAAHLNPALTIAFAFKSGDWSNVLPFIVAQLLGGFFVNYEPIEMKKIDDLTEEFEDLRSKLKMLRV